MFDAMIVNSLMSKQYFNVLFIDLRKIKPEGSLYSSNLVSQLVSSVDEGQLFQLFAPVTSAEERVSVWDAVQDIQPIRTSFSEKDAFICIHFKCRSLKPPFKVIKKALTHNSLFKDLSFDMLSYDKTLNVSSLFHAHVDHKRVLKKEINPPFSRK